VGILHVTLVEAKELLKTDVFGSTDPFVEMFMPGDDKKQKSKVRHQCPPRTHWPTSHWRSPTLLDTLGFGPISRPCGQHNQVPFRCLEQLICADSLPVGPARR
jgi:hypothetical protein